MNSSNKRRWLSGWRLVLGVLVLASGAWAVKHFFFTPPPQPQVITAKVSVEDLEDTVLASGTILAAKEVSVGAQVSGQIKRLYVGLGDRLRQGDLIAEIDAPSQVNALRNAQAQVALLQAQRQAKLALQAQAQQVLTRQQRLLAHDAGSQAAVDDAQATLATTTADIAVTDAQLRQAAISVDTAQVNLSYTRITAPTDGVVEAVLAEEGRTINALQSAPSIIKLAKLDTMLVKAQIAEADVVRIRPGLPVYFTILGEPLRRYEAKLRAIEPVPEAAQVDAKTGSNSSTSSAIYYNALFDVPNPEGKLRVSMTAQVFVVLDKVSQALVIPASALGKRNRQDSTYAVDVLEGPPGRQKVVSRQVKIGLNNRVQAQVLSGLKAGELVVVGDASATTGGAGGRRPPGMF